MQLVKECKRCFEAKDINDYHKNKKTPDGRSYYCKTCSVRRKAAGKLVHAAAAEAMRMRSYARWISEHAEWLEEYDKVHNLKGRKGGFLPNSYFEEE